MIRLEVDDSANMEVSENTFLVRKPVVVLSAGMLVLTCVLAAYLEMKIDVGRLAMSNLPMAVLLPFVFWILGNALLKRNLPFLSLTTAEIRLMLCLIWVGGSFAGANWASMWVGMVAGPRYLVSPENRWEELIFDHLAWWMYPTDAPGIVDRFYLGLNATETVPWGAWLAPIFWATAIALAITAIAVGLTAIFQKQWVQYERLTYPLAQTTLELTEGFDRKRGWPPFVKKWMFWTGFAIAAAPLLWNIVGYFVEGFPRIALFDPLWSQGGTRGVQLSRHLPSFAFSYRILPTVIGFTFLCDLNILFSLWSVYLAGMWAQYGMNRVGFTVGMAGQELDGGGILSLFTRGAMLGLAFWAFWVARGHLKRVFRQAWKTPKGEPFETAILSPRLAVIVLLGGFLFMIFWFFQTKCDPIVALLWVLFFWINTFVSMKFLAASGFAYLLPFWSGGPVENLETWIGTSNMSDASIVNTRVINFRLLSGWRVPTVIPHVVQIRTPIRNSNWLIWGGVIIGAIAAASYTIWLCYQEGGANMDYPSMVGDPLNMYSNYARIVADSDRIVLDPWRITIWIGGMGLGILLTILQTRLRWWPIHPMGVMVLHNWYMRVYMLDIFIVWLTKSLILKYGGITLYRRLKPCCYGLIVGFVFAVGLSCLIDVIWFPGQGHPIHHW